MRDFAWILAVAFVGAVFIIGALIAGEECKLDDYRRNVNLCATTADTPAEFRACVEVAE